MDKLEQLYKGLFDSGDYTKSFDEFKAQFSNPEAIAKLHEGLIKSGDYTKSLEDFNNQFFSNIKKKDASQSIAANQDLASGGDTTNTNTSSDIQKQPDLPNTITPQDNNQNVTDVTPIPKNQFLQNANDGILSTDLKTIITDPKTARDNFFAPYNILSKDDLTNQINKQSKFDGFTRKDTSTTGIDIVNKIREGTGEKPINPKNTTTSTKPFIDKLRESFKLEIENNVRKENAIRDWTLSVQNKIEQNGGKSDYLSPEHIKALGLDPEYLKTDQIKIDGKSTSLADAKDKIESNDFISKIHDGTAKVTFNDNGILPQEQINRLKDIYTVNKNAGSLLSDKFNTMLSATTSIISGAIKGGGQLAEELLMSAGVSKENIDAFNRVVDNPLNPTNPIALTRALDALTENQRKAIRIGKFERAGDALKAGDYLEFTNMVTNQAASFAPIIAATAIAPEATPYIMGLSSVSETIEQMRKENELGLSDYNHLQTAANAGLKGLVTLGMFKYVTVPMLSKYAEADLVKAGLTGSGRLAAIGKIFGANALKDFVANNIFITGSSIVNKGIDNITGVKSDQDLLKTLGNDIIDAGALSLFTAGLGTAFGATKGQFLKRGLFKQAVEPLFLDANTRDLIDKHIELKAKIKSGEYSPEIKKMAIESAKEMEGKINLSISKNKEVVNNIPDKEVEKLAQSKDEILALDREIEKLGEKSKQAEPLVNIRDNKISDLNKKIEGFRKDVNPDLTNINERFVETVKKANEVGVDTPQGQELLKESEKIKQEFEDVKNKTKIPEDKNTTDVVFKEDKNAITDAIDNNKVYVYDGRKGVITTDGQQIVFETGKDIFELGNKDELSNATLDKFGITKDTSRPIIDDNNNVTVNGKKYLNNFSNPKSAITKTKNGYSVSLETENGQKRNFRGAKADEIVYQYKLKEFKDNETEYKAKIERAHKLADEAIEAQRKIREASPKRKDKSIRKGEPVKVEPIKTKPKEKDLFSEKQAKGDITTNGDLQPNVKPSDKKPESKDVQPTVKPTEDKGNVKVDKKEIPIFDDKAENKFANEKLTEKDNPKQEPSIKVIESKAESSKKTKLNKAVKEVDKKLNQALDIEVKKVSDISTDENRFQGRKGLNEDVVNDIAVNWNDANQDPIHIWKDPKDGKTYVLSGHHRLAAAKKAGVKDVKVIDRSADFTEKQAIKFATEDANANRTMETPLERAETLRKKRANGDSKDDIKDFLKREGRNKIFIENLSYLNPKGLVIQALEAFSKNTDKQNQNEIEKYADWIGDARKRNKELTDAHEKELFDFLNNKETSKRFTNKADFLSKVNSITESMFFKPEEPLNIARFKNKTEGEKEYDKDVSEQKAKISELESKRDNIKDRLNNPNNPDYINPNASDYKDVVEKSNKVIQDIEKSLKVERAKLLEIYQNKGKYQRSGIDQLGLFEEPKIDYINTDKFTKIANDLRNASDKIKGVKFIKTIADANKLQSDPFGVIKLTWDGAIELTAKALEGSASLLEAIGKGIELIKDADWYKNLSDESKRVVVNKYKQVVKKISATDFAKIDSDILASLFSKSDAIFKKLAKRGERINDLRSELKKHIKKAIKSDEISRITKRDLGVILTEISKKNITNRSLQKAILRINDISHNLNSKKTFDRINNILDKKFTKKENRKVKANLTNEEAANILTDVKNILRTYSDVGRSKNIEVPLKAKGARIDFLDKLTKSLEDLKAKGDLTDAENAKIRGKEIAIDILNALTTKDAERRNKMLRDAHDEIKSIFENGKSLLKETIRKRIESDKRIMSELDDDANPKHLKTVKSVAKLTDENKGAFKSIGRFLHMMLKGRVTASLDLIATEISKKRFETRDESPWVRLVNHFKLREAKKQSMIRNHSNNLIETQKKLFGSLFKFDEALNKRVNFKITKDVSKRDIIDKNTPKPKEDIITENVDFSNSELLNVWMNAHDPENLPGLEASGFDRNNLDKIDKILPDNLKEYGRVLFSEYRKIGDELQDTYIAMNNHSLLLRDFYAGHLKREGFAIKDDNELNGINVGTLDFGSLKERVKNNIPIVPMDVNGLFLRHLSEASHYIAFAEANRLFKKIINNQDIKKSILLNNGNVGDLILKSLEFYKKNDFEKGGVKGYEVADKMLRNVATALLSLKTKIGMTQTISIVNGALEMPLNMTRKDMANYYNVSNMVNATRHLFRESEYLKNRYGSGHFFENAILGLSTLAKKSEFHLKNPTAEATRKMADKYYKEAKAIMMANVKVGDAIGVLGNIPVYLGWKDVFKKRGYSEARAEKLAMDKFNIVVDRTQQTISAFGKSKWQKDPILRYIMMFSSAGLQNHNNALYYGGELIKAIKKQEHKGKNIRNALGYINYRFAQPMLYAWVASIFGGSLYRGVFGRKDDKTENDKGLVSAMILGNTQTVPVLGTSMKLFVDKLLLNKKHSFGGLLNAQVYEVAKRMEGHINSAINAKTPKTRRKNLKKSLEDFGIILGVPSFIDKQINDWDKIYNSPIYSVGEKIDFGLGFSKFAIDNKKESKKSSSGNKSNTKPKETRDEKEKRIEVLQ